MCSQAKRFVKAGLALCAALLTYTLFYLLSQRAVGSFSEMVDRAAELVEISFASGMILWWTGGLVELLHNRAQRT